MKSKTKQILNQISERRGIISKLQLNLAEATYLFENDKLKLESMRCPHVDASLLDLSKIQARIRKWAAKLDKIEQELHIRNSNKLPTVTEIREEIKNERQHASK